MKTINSICMIHDDEIQRLITKKGKSFSIRETLFFPVLFSVWDVEYKSFFRKARKSRSITGVDLVKGGSGLADRLPEFTVKEVEETQIIQPLLSKDEKQRESREFIRKYYIHYKRVWSPPNIQLIREEIIHLPYTIFSESMGKSQNNRLFLFEHSSMNIDLLSNYHHIELQCLAALKGGEHE